MNGARDEQPILYLRFSREQGSDAGSRHEGGGAEEAGEQAWSSRDKTADAGSDQINSKK